LHSGKSDQISSFTLPLSLVSGLSWSPLELRPRAGDPGFREHLEDSWDQTERLLDFR
jgi:hypothetical protein